MEPQDDAFGTLIRYHRKKAGMSRRELALLAGTGQTVIYQLEHGKQSVRLDVLLKIMAALNLTFQIEGPFLDEFNALKEDQNEHRSTDR